MILCPEELGVMLLTWSAKANLVSVLWNERRRNALITIGTLLDKGCFLESSKREWMGEEMVLFFQIFQMLCVQSTQRNSWGGDSFWSNGKVTELAMNQWATQPWLDLDNVTSATAQFLYQPAKHSKDSLSSSSISHYFQFHRQYIFIKENAKHK